jgi:hypothetical protein
LATPGLAKAEALVEAAGGLVGRPDFQEDAALPSGQKRAQERAGDALAAAIGRDVQVYDLGLVGRRTKDV